MELALLLSSKEPPLQHSFTLFDFSILTLLSSVVLFFALMLPVNPWTVDGWYASSIMLHGVFPEADNYAPISAPAIQYYVSHQIAVFCGLDLKGEFYLNVMIQHFMVLLACILVYLSCLMKSSRGIAAAVALALLLFIEVIGLPLKLWSENSGILLVAAFMYTMLCIEQSLVDRDNAPSILQISIICAIFAVLVLTRMIPSLFLLGLGVFFYGRMKTGRLTVLLSALILSSIALMSCLMISNENRFGRGELTNSTGRHLWQGVTTIADQALAGVTAYEELKKHNPDLSGSPWWEVSILLPLEASNKNRLSNEFTYRDRVLKDLALQAIVREPFNYLLLGLKKIRRVADFPYKIGYDKAAWMNPLDAETLLPPLANAYLNVPNSAVEQVNRILDPLEQIFRLLYVIVIFFVLTTWIAMALTILPGQIALGLTNGTKILRLINPYAAMVGFLMFTSAVGYNILAGLGLIRSSLHLLIFFTLTMGGLFMFWRGSSGHNWGSVSNRFDVSSVSYSVFLFMFFVPLWVSWQLEYPNSRNAVLYWPCLSLAFATGVKFWVSFWQVGMGRAVLFPSPRFNGHP